MLLRLSIHDGTEVLMQDSFGPATAQHRTAVVVDSLSFLLLRHSPATLCRWLTSSDYTHTLCLLHSDLHEEKVLSRLGYVATSNVKVTAPVSVAASGYTGVVCTTHRKPSGKILRQVQ